MKENSGKRKPTLPEMGKFVNVIKFFLKFKF